MNEDALRMQLLALGGVLKELVDQSKVRIATDIERNSEFAALLSIVSELAERAEVKDLMGHYQFRKQWWHGRLLEQVGSQGGESLAAIVDLRALEDVSTATDYPSLWEPLPPKDEQ